MVDSWSRLLIESAAARVEASVSINLQGRFVYAISPCRRAPRRHGPGTELAEISTTAPAFMFSPALPPPLNESLSETSPLKTSLRSSRSLAMDGIHDDQCSVLVQTFSAGLGAMTGLGREECLDE